MRRKVDRFISQRDFTNSSLSLSKHIEDPLLPLQFEGGDSNWEGLPKQIKVDTEKIVNNKTIKAKHLQYEIFDQAFFKVPSQSFVEEIGTSINTKSGQFDANDFDIQQLSEQLNNLATKMANYSIEMQNRDPDGAKDYMKHLLSTEYTAKRPDFDANKGQKLFDLYMKEFYDLIQFDNTILKVNNEETNKFEDCTIKDIVQDAFQFDDDTGYNTNQSHHQHQHNINIIHKTLLCSGQIDAKIWLKELRQTFYQSENEIGELKLELSDIFLDGKEKQQNGAMVLHKYQGNEVCHLFNQNYSGLFNHIQKGDQLYFFSVTEMEEDIKGFNIRLNNWTLTNDQNIEQDHESSTFQLKITQTEINTKLGTDEGKLMGVIFIKGNQNMFSEDTKQPCCFFALIYAKEEVKNSKICYDVRHISNPEKSLRDIFLPPKADKDNAKFFQDKQPVIFQISAQKILDQMVLIGKMSKEDNRKIMLKLLQKRNQFDQKKNINKMMKISKQESVDKQDKQLKPFIDMFIVGSLNDQVYEQVHELFFIDNNLEHYRPENDIMKNQDILDTKEHLVECLQLMSLSNTCNIVKFNSFSDQPATEDKLKCRGQIELLKRLIEMDNHQQLQLNKKKSFKADEDSQNQGNDEITKQSDDNNQIDLENPAQIDEIDNKQKVTKQIGWMEIDRGMRFYSCSTIIDNLNRVMIMNLYHKQDSNKSYIFKLPLQNLNLTWKSMYSGANLGLNDVKLTGYNKLFFEVFKRNNSQNMDLPNPRFIVSKKFDNIARDVRNIYLIQRQDDKEKLRISQDVNYSVKEMRSRFQMILSNQNHHDSFNHIENQPYKDKIIYSLIQDNMGDQIKGNDQFQVIQFSNYTNNQTRRNFQEEKVKKILQDKRAKEKGEKLESNLEELDDRKDILYQELKHEIKDKNSNYKNEFTLEDRYIILQNFIYVEDDREDIPVLCIGKEYKSVQFAILRFNEIKAIISLRVTQEEIGLNIDNQKSFNQNYHEILQFCASSDIKEGYDLDGTRYMFQNYTVIIHFQKMLRLRMNEFQVKWIPNKDPKTKDKDPYKVKITLIKMRDVIFKKKHEGMSIKKIFVQPLLESQIESSGNEVAESQKQDEKKYYSIEGIQVAMKIEEGKICYFNFRNLSSSDQVDKFVTYNQRLFMTSTKIITQEHISGIYVETQFKNIIENDLQSDTVNSNMFKNSQAFSVLREANINGLNSVPFDFIGLMDMPLINDYWYQLQKKGSYDDINNRAKVETIDLLQSNYKRYFTPFQSLKGFQMLNQLGLIESSTLQQSQHEFKSIMLRNQQNKIENKVAGKAQQGLAIIGGGVAKIGGGFNTMFDDEKIGVSRDPSQIVAIFSRLNKQQDDRQFDFKHFKDIRTSNFSMSLIDRVLRNDENAQRFKIFRKKGIIVDGKDPITSNMDLQSVIQYPLDQNDQKMTDIYLRELYENNTYSINKYSQMMRIMPLILSKKNYNSDDYFKFFTDSDNQFQTDDVDRKDNDDEEDEIIDDEIFKGEEIPEYITFSQFFPQKLQEQIDSFTDKKVQIFTEESTANLNNLTVTSTLRQQFNLLNQEYKSKGSKYEVKASHIDFKPFILGKKLRALENAESLQDIKLIQEINMNDYEISKMMGQIMNSTKGKVDQQKAIRDIVDNQYKQTQKFFYINLILYLVGYFFPLISQMKSKDRDKVLFCNVSCLIMQIYCLIYESISIQADGYKVYFSSWWNFVDCLTIATYFIYFFFRIEQLDKMILPDMPDVSDSQEENWKKGLDQDGRMKFQNDNFVPQYENELILYGPIIHVLLIMTAFLKLMYYLRCNSEFGQFVQLIISCCIDVQIFAFFFVSWVMIFSHLFMVVGSSFDDEDYPLLQSLTYYFQTYRNSIGDIAPPKYDYWVHMHELGMRKYGENKVWGYSQCMIYMVWVLWLMNQFFNFILLLNFLIAIVSQSYDRVISESINYQYSHKSELNEETQRFFKVFRKPKSFDIMCIVSSHEDDPDQNDQIQGLSYSIKQYVKTQVSALQDDVTSRFDRSDKQNEQAVQKLRKYMDEQFVQNFEAISFVKSKLINVAEKVGKGASHDDDDVGNAKKLQELINQSIVLLEKVSMKQAEDKKEFTQSIQQLREDKQELNEKSDSIKTILDENSQRDQKCMAEQQEAQKKTDDAIEEINKKLQETLQANQEIQGKLNSALEANEGIVNQLEASKKDIANLMEVVEKQNSNYQALSQNVEQMNKEITDEVTKQQSLIEEVNQSVQGFDPKLTQLKEIIEKQEEDKQEEDAQ